jgi:catechol 2,3-dioxygenase
MNDTATRSETRTGGAPPATRLGPVHIAVTDLERALPVWRDLVGLTVLRRDTRSVALGAGDRTLIVLEEGAARPVVQNTAGLYHVAIHVPERRDLARAIARMVSTGYRNAPTDHLITETTYLWDPDGNGIEMTFETPWRGTLKSDGSNYYGVTADGRRHSGRDAVDLESMFGELTEGERLDVPLPAGTRVGHVHLHVGNLDDAMRFYSEGVGFPPLMMNRRIRMADVASTYPPHIMAFNTWAGEGAQQPPEGSAGLRHFTVEYPDDASLENATGRLQAQGANPVRVDGAVEFRDPSGNRVRLKRA